MTSIPASSHLRPLDVARMLATTPPPIPWLIEPLLIPGELTMLTGREGRGKSMMSQAMSVAIADPAAGSDVLGMPAKPGRMMVVDAENGPHEIHRRIHGIGLTRPDDYLIYEASGLNLRHAEHRDELHRAVVAARPTVVILDSLVSLAPGLRENEASEVQPVLQGIQAIARETGAAILLLHHAGKGETGAEYRGSSAIGGVVTMAVSMTAHAGDPDPARRELVWWKCRPCAKPDPIWFRIEHEDGRLRLARTEPFEGGSAAGAPVQADLAEQILEALRKGEAHSKARLAARIGRSRDDRTYRAAISRLEQDGIVIADRAGVRLAEPGVVPGVAPTTDDYHALNTRRGVVPEPLGGGGTTPHSDGPREAIFDVEPEVA